MTRILTFDVDGVVAGGGHIAPENQSGERYAALPLLALQAPDVVNQLALSYPLYFVSSRNFEGATVVTRAWLGRRGFSLATIAGVMTGISRQQKPAMCALLGSALHVDDDPWVVEALMPRSLLMYNEQWAENRAASRHLPTVLGWAQLTQALAGWLQPQQLELPIGRVQ